MIYENINQALGLTKPAPLTAAEEEPKEEDNKDQEE